jgi:hypothetical protein
MCTKLTSFVHSQPALHAEQEALQSWLKLLHPELLLSARADLSLRDPERDERTRKQDSRVMDMNREETCAAVPAPASISAQLIGYEWARGTIGESGGAVYRLHGKADAPDLYLCI